LARFFEIISKLLPDRGFAGKEEAIARLDPNKIYLENVRSVLGVSSGSAARICETAVRQGLFRKYVEVVCPDGAVAVSAEFDAELPETVRCWKEEDGNFEEVEFSTRGLSKTTFYRLNDESAPRQPQRQTA
jgi:hypothetical protein